LREVSVIEITTGVALGTWISACRIEWRKGHEALAQWFEAFAQRPSMQKTQPATG